MKSYGPGLQATRSFNAYVLIAWSRDNSWGGGGNREGEASTMGGSEAKTPTHTQPTSLGTSFSDSRALR